MSFQLLSDTIQRMIPHLPAVKASAEPPFDLRQAAAMLALNAYGQVVLQNHSLVNVGALALSLDPLVVYRPDAAAVAQVEATDLRNLPAEPPRLLQKAFLIESPDPAQIQLFGNTVALGGYRIGADWWLICLRHPDGIAVIRWNPIWAQEEEVEAGIVYDHSPLINNEAEWAEDGKQAARFCIVLGLLLDAEATPIAERVKEPPKGPAPRYGQKKQPATGWQVRSLTVPPKKAPASEERATDAADSPAASGRQAETVTVRGYLKRQAYGPGRMEHKWIYVAAYEARRWIAPGPRRINIHGQQ